MLKTYRILFWLTLLVVLFLALDPRPPEVPGSDKLHHALAFFVLLIGATIAYPAARLFPLAAALSGFGALIEFLQGLPVIHRDRDFKDWITDTAAIAVAVMVVLAARAIWRAGERGNLQS